jgi:hypothetical protein
MYFTRVRGPRPLMAGVRRQEGIAMKTRCSIIFIAILCAISCVIRDRIDPNCLSSSGSLPSESKDIFILKGVITDPHGAAVKDAKVEILDKAQNVLVCTYAIENGSWYLAVNISRQPASGRMSKRYYNPIIKKGMFQEDKVGTTQVWNAVLTEEKDNQILE